jgi:uncharacterized membrane protein YfhO
MQTYTQSKIVAFVNASTDGLIYISDNYVPQWKAYVDGKPEEILRANYSFMAIPVTKGDHTVALQYKDSKEIAALIISGIVIFAGIVGLYLLRKKKYLQF